MHVGRKIIVASAGASAALAVTAAGAASALADTSGSAKPQMSIPATPEPGYTYPSNTDPDRPGIQQAEVDELGPEWVSDEYKRDLARDLLQ